MDRNSKITIIGIIISVGVTLVVSLDSLPGFPELPDVLIADDVIFSDKYGYTMTAPNSSDWEIFTKKSVLDDFEISSVPWNINTRGELTSVIVNNESISDESDGFVLTMAGVFVKDIGDGFTFDEYVSKLETDLSNMHPTVKFTTSDGVGIYQHQIAYFLLKCDEVTASGCVEVSGFDTVVMNDGKLYTISQLISAKRTNVEMLSMVIDPNDKGPIDLIISKKHKDLVSMIGSFQFL